MAKNYVYWDQIDATTEEFVDYMIQQSQTPLTYDPDAYDEPEDYSVPTDLITEISCDVRDFIVELLEKDYGCYYPPLEV